MNRASHTRSAPSLGALILFGAVCLSVPAAAQTDPRDQPRSFGQGPDAALKAYRKEVPPDADSSAPGSNRSMAQRTESFMKAHSASEFFSGGPPMPDHTIPDPPANEEDLRK